MQKKISSISTDFSFEPFIGYISSYFHNRPSGVKLFEIYQIYITVHSFSVNKYPTKSLLLDFNYYYQPSWISHKYYNNRYTIYRAYYIKKFNFLGH